MIFFTQDLFFGLALDNPDAKKVIEDKKKHKTLIYSILCFRKKFE